MQENSGIMQKKVKNLTRNYGKKSRVMKKKSRILHVIMKKSQDL